MNHFRGKSLRAVKKDKMVLMSNYNQSAYEWDLLIIA